MLRSVIFSIALSMTVPVSAGTSDFTALDDSLSTAIERLSEQWDFVGAFCAAVEQLDRRSRHFEPGHPAIVESHRRVGVVLRRAGRHGRACEQLEYTLFLARRALDPGTDAFVQIVIDVSRARRLAGHRADAHDAIDEAGRLVEAHPRISELVRADFLHADGSLDRKHEPYDTIEPRYREALAIRTRVLGPDHPMTIDTMAWLGHLLRQQGRFNDAEALWWRAIELARSSDIPRLGIINILTMQLGMARLHRGDPAAAEDLLREAMELQDDVATRVPLWFGVNRPRHGSKRDAGAVAHGGRP